MKQDSFRILDVIDVDMYHYTYEERSEVRNLFSRVYDHDFDDFDEIETEYNGFVALVKHNGTSTIVICVINTIPYILVHESYHVMMRLVDMLHLETDSNAEEWSANMLEYIYKQLDNFYNDGLKNELN